MDRVPTGIHGLDELIEGGIPKGRTVLLTGACGTGKSISAMQFIYQGALTYKEPGLYVTFDERPDLLRQDALRFGWNLKQLEDANLLRIVDATIGKVGLASEEKYSLKSDEFDLDRLILEIMSHAKDLKARRIVIDSIPSLSFRFKDNADIRNAILKLTFALMKTGLTSILVSEIDEGSHSLSKFGVEEFVADGVVVLHYVGGLGTQGGRTILVRKMRATKHSEEIHSLQISDAGVTVRPGFDDSKDPLARF